MSDHMIQKADDQIEAGLSERELLLAEIDTLRARIEEAERALGFYGRMESYKEFNNLSDPSKNRRTTEVKMDNGKRARDYFKKWEDVK